MKKSERAVQDLVLRAAEDPELTMERATVELMRLALWAGATTGNVSLTGVGEVLGGVATVKKSGGTGKGVVEEIREWRDSVKDGLTGHPGLDGSEST